MSREPDRTRPGAQPGRGAVLSDAELVQAARCGDKRAFVEIVARHQAMVCGIALGVLGDFAASEDAGQEAFLTAWRKLHELREPERLRSWLGKIARNAALGHLRCQRGHGKIEEAEELADEAPAPDEATASKEETALVFESLAKLPETYRLPLVLFYREHHSTRAVAEALGLTEDTVRQRLARGREMLRDRMSTLVEVVLVRTGPTPIFTMTIAAVIGALATPAAVSGSVFSAAAAGTTSSAPSAGSLAGLIGGGKIIVITAGLVAAVCFQVGYRLATEPSSPDARAGSSGPLEGGTEASGASRRSSLEETALFAEWKQLHDTYGRTPEAMTNLYQAIAGMPEPLRRRGFRAALIAEWAQVEPTNGLRFLLQRINDPRQRQQFFEEWLEHDARAAVDALLASHRGGEVARDSLLALARRAPQRLAEVVSRLPRTDTYGDKQVQTAFALVAGNNLDSARASAELVKGPNREQALSGVAQVWGRTDLEGAIAWAKTFREPTAHDEIIRAALTGKAAFEPVTALERVGLIAPGGRQGYSGSSTGGRVLRQAALADFDATIHWLAAHPGRLGQNDLLGLVDAVTEKLNADPVGFLARAAASGALAVMLPALNDALLNDSSGQRAAVWDWVKNQPDDETTRALKRQVLSAAGAQDAAWAFRLVTELPQTAEGDAQLQWLASSFFKDGLLMPGFAQLLEQAPARLRQPLLEGAFNNLRPDTLGEPRSWLTRLMELSDASRPRGITTLALTWAVQAPDAALQWLLSLPAGEASSAVLAEVLKTWAARDSQGASSWVAGSAFTPEHKAALFALVEAATKAEDGP